MGALKKIAIAAIREVPGLSVCARHVASGNADPAITLFRLLQTPCTLKLSDGGAAMIPGALHLPNGETKMNKSELIEAVAAKTEMTKAAAGRVVEAVLESIAETVAKGDAVSVIGFGTFESRKRAARTGKNPQTGEVLKIAAATVPAFKAGKAFKDRVAASAGKKGGKKK